MFNVGAGEIVFILIAALLILGPKQLPELARGIGRFLREFRRQTDEVRTVVEREFYRMDQDLEPLPKLAPPEGTRASALGAPLGAPAVDPAPAPAQGAAPDAPAAPAAPAALEPSLATTQPMAPVTPEEVARAQGPKPS